MAFDYRTPFPASVPANVPEFQRSFQHEDWIDGRSVVQAEANEIEEGFNSRLHKIEADLDALSTDTGRAFAALAAMRTSLSALLNEIRAEVQRLDRSPPWLEAQLRPGWTGSGGTTAGYRKENESVVSLIGYLESQSGASSVLFTLPQEYRPSFHRRFAIPVWYSGSTIATDRLLVGTDGTVQLESSQGAIPSRLSLDGIYFAQDSRESSTSSAGFRDDIGIGGDQL
jgi:hypothetical protein